MRDVAKVYGRVKSIEARWLDSQHGKQVAATKEYYDDSQMGRQRVPNELAYAISHPLAPNQAPAVG